MYGPPVQSYGRYVYLCVHNIRNVQYRVFYVCCSGEWIFLAKIKVRIGVVAAVRAAVGVVVGMVLRLG